jgi:hypothetical protein
MTKAHPKLASLKSGDLVLLVEQSHHGRKGRKYWVEVLSILNIGRKYGYILRHDIEEPFDLNTGESVHKDGNARANGFGFDIYLTKKRI